MHQTMAHGTAETRGAQRPAGGAERAKARAPVGTIPGSALCSIERVDWLLLALSTLYLLAGGSPLPQPWLAAGTVASFAALLVTLRLPRFARLDTRHRLWLTVAAMVLLVAVVASQTGGLRSTLTNLFLLPVVLAAATLGGAATVSALLAVAAALVVLHVPGAEPGRTPVVFAVAVGAEFLPLVLVGYLAQRLAASLRTAEHRLRELAELDRHTGLLNMQTFNEQLARECARVSAEGGRFALLMLDVEGLQQLNDAYGYATGNLALKTVADAVQRTIRASDLAGRFGGDEFAVVIADANPELAEVVAQRLRNTVHHSLFPAAGRMLRVTVNVGCASFPRDARNLRDLLATANRRMRQDKELRRRVDPGRS